MNNILTLFRNLFSPPRDLILVMAAIWVGLWLAEKRSPKHGVSTNDLNNIVFYPLLGYILGGRILYVLEKLSAFAQNPQSLISLNLDLFDPIGGMVVTGIVALIYGQRQKLSLWPTLDAITPLLAVFALGLGLAHLASGSAFGKETTLPWGIQLWGATRHPSQIYEIIASSLILGLLWFRKTDSPPGISFLTFTALTSGARVFLEAFRGDSTLVFGGFRAAQIVAWCILAISLFLLDKKSKISFAKVAIRKQE
jgi:phosphatidylglycerol:prolipoprotein diacylglycerol transferase